MSEDVTAQYVDEMDTEDLGALGGTLNGDPCSLLGVVGALPGYIRGIQGLYKGYIRYWD